MFGFIIPAMSKEHVEKQVVQLIEHRNKRVESKDGSHERHYYRKGEHLCRLPNVSLPPTVNILLNSSSLWIETGEYKYTPSLLIKAFFVRKDGKDISEDIFSVFIADKKRCIAQKWGIVPRSAWNKQRHQYWDENFVKALFTHTALCEKSPAKNVNKSAYAIREDITFKKMEEWYLQANNEAVKIKDKKR